MAKTKTPAPQKGSSKTEKAEKGKKEKKEVEKKPSVKYPDVELGDSPNYETAFAKLNFNVSTTKKWMTNHYAKHYDKGYTEFLRKRLAEKKAKDDAKEAVEMSKSKGKDKKDDKSKSKSKDTKTKKEEDSDEKPKAIKTSIKKAHYALTAVEEAVCLSVIDLTVNRLEKNKSGNYILTLENVVDSMRLEDEYMFTFGKYLSPGKYDNSQEYSKQLTLKKEEFDKFVEKYAFKGGSANLQIDDDRDGSYNFLMYVLLQNRIMLSDTAYTMMMYNKKSSVDFRAIQHAVRVQYTGKLRQLILQKLDEKWRIVKGDKDGGEDEDSKSSGSKHGSKDSKDKETSKKSKSSKSSKKDESESEAESEAEESEAEESEGSDSD